MELGKNNGGLVGLLGPPPKEERGRKRIKAENGSSLLVVPYPILASGNDQSCVTITGKPAKTYRQERTRRSHAWPTNTVFRSLQVSLKRKK